MMRTPEVTPTKPDVNALDAPTMPDSPRALASRQRRRCGHKWDERDPDHVPAMDHPARAHFGAPRNIRGESMAMTAVAEVWDQIQTGTCVAQAACNAIDVSLAIRDIYQPPASRRFAFAMALALARKSKGQQLVDDGCYPRFLMQGLRDYGIPTENDWSFYNQRREIDDALVVTEPPLDVLEKANSFHVSDWLRIDTRGPQLVDEIAYYIDQNHPVIYATEGDAFQSYEGGTIRPSQSPGPDGHDTLLLGQRLEDGRRRIRGLNSWGASWGERGFYWAEEDFLANDRAGDFYVVLVAAGPGKLWQPKEASK